MDRWDSGFFVVSLASSKYTLPTVEKYRLKIQIYKKSKRNYEQNMLFYVLSAKWFHYFHSLRLWLIFFAEIDCDWIPIGFWLYAMRVWQLYQHQHTLKQLALTFHRPKCVPNCKQSILWFEIKAVDCSESIHWKTTPTEFTFKWNS